jgi:phosphatidylinositol-4,5-bisphosphate 3-kinase
MPELSDYSDIEYLKMRLSLNLSEQEATNKFKREIYDSLNTTWRKLDNLIHNIKRK